MQETSVISSWTTFRSFVIDNDLLVKKGTKPGSAGYTHLLLDGGKLSVPERQMEAFMQAYYRSCVFENERLYISEQKTQPLFSMLVELDLYMDEKMTDEQFVALIRASQQAIGEHISDDYDKRVVVCTAPLGEKQKHPRDAGRMCYKYGVHLVWHELAVTSKIAKMLRWALINAYEKATEAGEIPSPATPWPEVVDPAVFNKNGLRLVWSRKTKICPACNGRSVKRTKVPPPSSMSEQLSAAAANDKGKKRGWMTFSFHAAAAAADDNEDDVTVCSVCEGHQKIDAGRPYDFYGAYTKDGVRDDKRCVEFKNDAYKILLASSIRVPSTVKYSVKFADEKASKDRLGKIKRAHKKGKTIPDKPAAPAPAAAAATSVECDKVVSVNSDGKQRTKLNTVDKTSEQFKVISGWISTLDDAPAVQEVRVNSIASNFYIATTTCKKCPNKGSAHTSSTNYFIIRVYGAQRRCFCQKPIAGTMGVTCKDWRGPIIPIPLDVAQEIFSKAHLNQYKTFKAKLQKQAVKAATADESTHPIYFLPPDTDSSSSFHGSNTQPSRRASMDSSFMIDVIGNGSASTPSSTITPPPLARTPTPGLKRTHSSFAMQSSGPICCVGDIPIGVINDRYGKLGGTHAFRVMKPPPAKKPFMSF